MTNSIPESALDADISILAQKGAGKTYTAKGIVERLLDEGARVLVIDPLSVWWGLKAGADGESPGYPVAVFGGPHGDMELSESMAVPLAKTLAHTNLPTVLDVAWMKKAEQMRFCKDLFETLFTENRDPLTLVLEEAHVFAPQSMGSGDAHVFHQVDRIARMGRAFGFRLVTITQRPARLHKDVLTQASTLIAMRMRHPLDQKPILDWVKANADSDFAKTVESDLATLSTGEGFVSCPDEDFFERVKFPLISTFDSSATPKRGQKRITPKTLADVDLSEIKAALAGDIETDEETAATPNVDIAAIKKTAYDEGYAAGYKDGHAAGYKKAYSAGTTDGLARAIDAIRSVESEPVADAQEQVRPTTTPAVPKPSTGKSEWNGPQQRVLGSLYKWKTLGHERPSRAQVAFLAGYSPSSGSFSNTVSSLRTANAIDYPENGKLSALIDAPSNLPGGFERLNGPQNKVIESLLRDHRQSRLELAESTGYSESSGSFSNTVSSLRTLGLIDYPKKGEVELQHWVLQVSNQTTNA